MPRAFFQRKIRHEISAELFLEKPGLNILGINHKEKGGLQEVNDWQGETVFVLVFRQLLKLNQWGSSNVSSFKRIGGVLAYFLVMIEFRTPNLLLGVFVFSTVSGQDAHFFSEKTGVVGSNWIATDLKLLNL